jgi:hypothetical protein
VQLNKDYQRAFLLEPTKLTRLVNQIHERLADHQPGSQHDRFEVYLSGDRHEELTNVDDVLALDNSSRRKIERLVIVCSASAPGAAQPEHQIEVDFARPKTSTGGGKQKIVAISVRSQDGSWARRTLSEVEEQVERTWQLHHVLPVMVLAGAAIFVLLFFLYQFSPIFLAGEPRAGIRTMWLQGSDIERFETLVRDPRVITDQELREVVTRQLRNVVELKRPPQATATRQLLYVGIPLGVVLVCIFVLLSTCYPSAVFFWGDHVARHERMLLRRKMLWGIIAAVVFLGPLSSLLYEGVSPASR